MLGSIAGGWLGDKYGKGRVMLVGLVIATAAMLYGWLGVHSQAGLMGLSIGVGLGTGLQVSLYAPLLGDLFGRGTRGFAVRHSHLWLWPHRRLGTFDLGYAP